jgi:putative redox protein
MKITITRIGNNFNLEARNEEGNTLQMDSSPDFGGLGKGMRPMQLLLSALGGCCAIDTISILEKQKQSLQGFEIEVNGTRESCESYSLFRNIQLHVKIRGAVDPEKADKAVRLSLEKYCSVAKTLEPTATINYSITIRS